MIYAILFIEFCKVGLFCVGGGYASMPLIQHCVVDTYHWMTMSEFVDIFTLSQMMPGAIGLNAATFAGTRIAGLGGAICASVGFVTPSFFIGIAFARIFLKYGDIGPVRGILNGLRPAVVALICAASLSFSLLALWNAEAIPHDFADFKVSALVILLLALAAIRRKFGVIKVLLGSGVLGLLFGLAGLL